MKKQLAIFSAIAACLILAIVVVLVYTTPRTVSFSAEISIDGETIPVEFSLIRKRFFGGSDKRYDTCRIGDEIDDITGFHVDKADNALHFNVNAIRSLNGFADSHTILELSAPLFADEPHLVNDNAEYAMLVRYNSTRELLYGKPVGDWVTPLMEVYRLCN